jgi:hypothetical protein
MGNQPLHGLFVPSAGRSPDRRLSVRLRRRVPRPAFSCHGDFCSKLLARDELKGPAECELSGILRRGLASNPDSPPLFTHDETTNASVGRLTDPHLDLFDQGFHNDSPLADLAN